MGTPVTDARFSDDAWFKSSYSGDSGCVGVALTPALVGVRDTKDLGDGPVLAFEAGEWAAFVDATVRGGFATDGLGL